MSRLARLRSPLRQKRGAITCLKAVLEPCWKSAGNIEAARTGLFIALLAVPASALADPIRTAPQERAVLLKFSCIRPDEKSVFETEESARANCPSDLGEIAGPDCPAVWQCKAPAPKARHSREYRTKEQAQANCPNGLVQGIASPGWYWVCAPVPPGTSAAKDIFQGQSEDIQKEYDQMIEKLYSGQKGAVKLPGENPFTKASDASKKSRQSQPAAAETDDPSRRGKKVGKPPIVCPPNPAGCITVKELGKSSEQLASKFIQACSGVTISFRWQSCGRFCTEHTENMPEGESFINYTNRIYPTPYDVTCKAP